MIVSRFLFILLIVLILILIAILFKRLADSIREYNRNNEDKAFNIKKGAYRVVEIVLSTGKLYTDFGQYTRPVTKKGVATGSAFKIGLDIMDNHINPVKNMKKILEPKVKETLLALQDAGDNAAKHGSDDAIGYVNECIAEVESMLSGLGVSLSISDIRKKLEEIRTQAQEIAEAETFEDAETCDESDGFGDQGDGNGRKQKNYYEILKVDKTATEDEIKESYRELVKEYHSDKFASAAQDVKDYAEDRLKDINEAKEILLDPEKRNQYDQDNQ